MADVVNSISTSPQVRSTSYVTSPGSSNAIVSPNIVEAIDRIFPKSPSQLLPQSFSDNLNGKKSSSKTVSQSQSSIISTLPCTVSMAHLTTDTTTTATAVFTGLTTSSGTKSPLMSSTPTSHMDLPSLTAQIKVNQVSSLRNGTVDVNLANSNAQKQLANPKRISKADLEIMNNCVADQNVKNGRPPRCSLSEKELSDSQSREQSDSDDMRQPFVALKKEKKKKKKKQAKISEHQNELEPEKNQKGLTDVSVLPKISKFSLHQVTTPGHLSEDEFCQDNTDTGMNSEVQACAAHNSSKGGASLFDSHSYSSMSIPPSTVDLISDAAGDVGYRKLSHKQKLPKVTRRKYHVYKDIRRIQKVFPPCFVVLKNVVHIPFQGCAFGQSFAFNLTLKERVKILSSLCAERKIECVSKQKTINDVFNYKNPLDNSICSNSEDEFRIPQGRSLRKRRQDICYVEPSEDDLLEDIAISSQRKKIGQSKKDSTITNDLMPEKGSSLNIDNQSLKDISAKKKAKLQSPSSLSEEDKDKITVKISPTKSGMPEALLLPGQVSTKDKRLALSQSQSTLPNFLLSTFSKSSLTASGAGKASSSDNVVYVYPKKSIFNTNAQISVVSDPGTKSVNVSKAPLQKKSTAVRGYRPGPASKTNRPLHVTSFAPVTTLSLATSTKSSNAAPILGLSGSTLMSPSLLQNFTMPATCPSLSNATPRNSSLPSNLCMVKIDGKDYLLSMPGSNNLLAQAGGSLSSTTTPAIPVSQTNLIPTVSGPRYMFYQPNASTMPSVRPVALPQNTSMTKEMAPAFSIPHLPTAVTVPGRVSSSAIHFLPTSFVPQNSSLTSASLQGGSVRVSAAPASIGVTSAHNLLSSSSSVTQPNITVTATPSVITSSASSAICLSSSLQPVSTTITSGTRHIRSLVSPLIAPGSSTVIPRHPGQTSTTTTNSSSVQLVAPNASVSGARCFRIIVPACSATGSSARIATLGTSALSSPLTRLSASSSLLPQRKHSVDKEMSPEKKAAKRRRLEKKYPLPPGVVIKTEPLDSPQPSPVIQSGSVRSLLSAQNIQNIQLITASSRSGPSGVQRFRIISPNTPGVVVGSRPVRLGSNVIIRAPIISNSSSRLLSSLSSSQITSTSLLPTSSSPSTLTTVTTVTTSTSVLATAARITQATATTTTTTTALVSTPTTASGTRGTISLLSPGALLLSSSTAVGTSSVPAASSIDTTPFSSSTPSILSRTVVVSSAQSLCGPVAVSSTSASYTSSSPAPPPESGKDQSTANNPAAGGGAAAVDIENVRQTIEKLQTFISAQEAQGLKGARLDKLKEVLSQKKSVLLQLEQEQEKSEKTDVAEDESDNFGASIEDPVVID